MELDAQANEGEVSIAIVGAVPVVGTFTEEVHVLQALEVDFKSSASVVFAELFTVHAESAAYKDVRSDADGFDRSAEDDVSIEDVQSAAGSNCVVAKTSAEVFSEEVFTGDAAAESVFIIVEFVAWEEASGVQTDAESRSECVAGRSHHLGLDDFAAFAGIGNRTSEGAGREGD